MCSISLVLRRLRTQDQITKNRKTRGYKTFASAAHHSSFIFRRLRTQAIKNRARVQDGFEFNLRTSSLSLVIANPWTGEPLIDCSQRTSIVRVKQVEQPICIIRFLCTNHLNKLSFHSNHLQLIIIIAKHPSTPSISVLSRDKVLLLARTS